MVLEDQKNGVIFVCEDLDIDKTIGTAYCVRISKREGSSSNMIISKEYRRRGGFQYVWEQIQSYYRKE